VSYRGDKGRYCSKECMAYLEPKLVPPNIEIEEETRRM